MASTCPRFLVIDQSLKDFEGHHFEYDASVLAAAGSLGWKCMLACNSAYPNEDLNSVPIVGRFRDAWNEPSGLLGKAMRRAAASMPRSARNILVGATAGRLRSKTMTRDVVPDRSFAGQVSAIINDKKLNARDHILIHTLNASQLIGLVESLASTPSMGPHLHVILRYDGTAVSTRAFALMERHRIRTLSLWTDTHELADQYRDLGARQIGVLPIPQLVPEGISQRERLPGPLVIGSLGGARGDKGFDLLPPLVRALASDYLPNAQARFLIQANYGVSREEPLMARCRRELGEFPETWVQLIDCAVDQASFWQLLRSVDILLLPYHAETYRRRSSGLLIQAGIAGIPTVVPRGTWLERNAPEGSAMVFTDEDDLERTVRAAVVSFNSLSSAARAAADEMRAQHNASSLVQALTAQRAVERSKPE